MKSKTYTLLSTVLTFVVIITMFFTAAATIVHGYDITWRGQKSFSDLTVNFSMYGFIFGKEGFIESIPANGFMIIGFIVLLISIFTHCFAIVTNKKALHIVDIIFDIFLIFSLSPIPITPAIKAYNASQSMPEDRIAIKATPYIVMIIFIIVALIDLIGTIANKNDLD